MSIILGIDPGTTTIGYCLLTSSGRKPHIMDMGIINTASTPALSDKLLEIAQDLGSIIDTHHPVACSIEKLFFKTNAKTAIDVAQARGVILYTCALRGVPIIEFTPMQLKKGICGSGNATKVQIQRALSILFLLDERRIQDDTADALGLAYLGWLSQCSSMKKNI